jgi:hypothetical protein
VNVICARLKGSGTFPERARLGNVQEQNFLTRGRRAVHATTIIETENSAFGQRSGVRVVRIY